jgi:hypothetical protein
MHVCEYIHKNTSIINTGAPLLELRENKLGEYAKK